MLSTSDMIAETLRRAILMGELSAGAQLRQEHIAAQHGVSHIPVREALRRCGEMSIVIFGLSGLLL
jgi:DNA-binding GntR family transcriptional regulator